MPIMKELERAFDAVAFTYEKLHLDYVKELYQTLFDYIEMNPNSNVLEVGSKGGQATVPILMTWCKLMVVDIENNIQKVTFAI